MVNRRPRTERTRCVVVDDRRSSIDGCGSGAADRRRPRGVPILESVLLEPNVKIDIMTHPKKKVEIKDTAQGYFLTVSRGNKVLERRGPSVSMRYIMKHALQHCGFDDEPKMPTIVDRWEVCS